MKRLALALLGCLISGLGWSQTDIIKVEYYFDTDPGCGSATEVPIIAAPELNNFSFSADINSVANGFHTLNVRCQDENLNWSNTYSRPFYKTSLAEVVPPANVVKVEYFFDTDPGYGSAIDVPVTPSLSISDHDFAVDLTSLADGFHTLNIRAQDSFGKWSASYSRPFYKVPAGSIVTAPNLEQAEYFFDADPGIGQGFNIPFSQSSAIETQSFVVPLSDVAPGFHTLSIRTKDANGSWSFAYSRPFYRLDISTVAPAPEITRVEYFIDADPGVGNGAEVTTSGGSQIEQSFTIPLDTVSTGFHTLTLRVIDINGYVSNSYSRPFYRSPEGLVSPAEPIVKAEYFFDEDPGVGNGFLLDVSPNTELADYVVPVDLNNTTTGEHVLHLRFQDASGQWSMVQSSVINACVHPIPVALAATDIAPGTMTARWTDLAASDSFLIYVSKDTFRTHLAGLEAKTILNTSHTLNNLSGGNYQYRVRAVGECPSGLSNIIHELLPFIAVQVEDSLTLVALYNSTQGANWNTKDNWLVGEVINWHGITLDNFKVVGISLPDNNLKGVATPLLATLKHLEILDLSGNQLTSIPDLSKIPTITTVDVSNNALDFGSLESNITINNFSYHQQSPIGTEETIQANAGELTALTLQTSGLHNNYQWFFNGTPVANTNANVLEILSSLETKGVYRCEVTNTLVPNLTLVSRNKTVIPVADMTGRLFAATGIAATEGKIILFNVNPDGAYDTTRQIAVHENGSYALENIELGEYLLLGFADTTLYPNALPTYYNNTLYWEDATKIFLTENIFARDIVAQQKPTKPTSGKGIIEGYLQEEIDDASGRVMAKKRVANAGVSVRRTERSARGKALELVAYVFTDEKGEFKFSQLPPDTYRINIQYPGYPMDNDSDIDIQVGENLDAYRVVEAEVVAEGKIVVRKLIVTSIDEKHDYQVDVFPNPSADYINLKFEKSSARNLTVLDASGRVVIQMKSTNQEEKIDVTNLNFGLYILNVEDGKNSRSFRVEIIGN